MNVEDLELRPYTARELYALGFTRMNLSRMVRAEVIENPSRGVYRVPHAAESADRAHWAAISTGTPGAVFCLYSAAIYYGLTENLGARLFVALPASARHRPDGGNLKYIRWSNPNSFEVGIDILRIENTDILITSPQRTLVDFFRYSSLNAKDKRITKLVDTAAFGDFMERFLPKFGSPGIKTNKIAKAFGVDVELRNHIGMLQATRPDLWLQYGLKEGTVVPSLNP